jgi:hypothetical protein
MKYLIDNQNNPQRKSGQEVSNSNAN